MTVKKSEKHAMRKMECELDGLYFSRYFMKQRFGHKMLIGRHHSIMQAALNRTMLAPSDPRFISRLIVNVPPGYTKTEMGVINYMARGLAINAQAKFLHLSYSDSLALLNSSTTREIVKSSEYQSMWPISIKDDSDSKKMWWTDENGGVYATSAAGQVTGFRAGHMSHDRFSGAMLIDDPVKPEDAHSELVREKINDRYNETMASRLAVETIPVIVIMQRVHDRDLSGYLLRGGSGEQWHHLDLPVIIDGGQPYPKDYTHGRPIEHGLDDGWLWEYKHNDQHENALKSHRRKWAAQYLQRPIKRDEERALWSEKTINRACEKELPAQAQRTLVAIDPAVTNTKTSDEHGIVVASKYGPESFGVLGDYSRRGSPSEWAHTAIAAYDRHEADAIVIEVNQGGDMCEETLRNAGFKGRVLRVHASKGKIPRAEPIAALYELGYVGHMSGLSKLENEMLDLDPLSGLANGVSPNRVDALVWGMTELSGGGQLSDLLKIAVGAN